MAKRRNIYDSYPPLSEEAKDLDRLDFTWRNLSSIFNFNGYIPIAAREAGLTAADVKRQQLVERARFFEKSRNVIANLRTLREFGFTPTNISSILNRAGTKAPATIAALCSKNIMLRFERLTGIGMNLDNIASMLNGVGAEAESTILALTEGDRFENLGAMVRHFGGSVISNQINLRYETIGSRLSIVDAVDVLYDQVKDELGQPAGIPAGAGGRIAEQSPGEDIAADHAEGLKV